jgi:membrane-bound serine protease (ClpP class)
MSLSLKISVRNAIVLVLLSQLKDNMLEQLIGSLISNLSRSLSQLYSSLFLRVEPWIIVLIVVTTAAFIAISIILGIRAHHRPVSAGREDLIGNTAVVNTALDPKGLVLVEGERWTAILDKGRAEPEEEVIVTKVEGLKLRVTRRETS